MSDQEIHNHIIDTLKPIGVNRVGIFGSFTRKEMKQDSDIDILVEFKDTFGLLKLIQIENTLSKLLNRKVDLITTRSLDPKIRPYIENDLQVIYE